MTDREQENSMPRLNQCDMACREEVDDGEQDPKNVDRNRALREFARRMDWLVFSWTREARPKEGGQ
jgi:hypothetical protein